MKKYINPYIWKGYLWCDGGWGPKNEVQEFMDTLTIDDHIIIEPTSIMLDSFGNVIGTEIGTLDIDGLTQLSKETSLKSCDEKYEVSFPGERLDCLEKFVDFLKTRTQAKFILEPLNCTDPIRLVVENNKEEVEFRIEKGVWVSRYDNPLPLAGW